MENEITFDMILQGLNTAALVVFIILFIRGEILARSVVDRILQEAENRTTAVVNKVMDGISEAVANGFMRAYQETDGFSSKLKREK